MKEKLDEIKAKYNQFSKENSSIASPHMHSLSQYRYKS